MRTEPQAMPPTGPDREEGLRITFTGDVHLGAIYADGQLFADGIREACRSSDAVVVNMEGPVTAGPPMPIPGAVLHSDPQSAEALRGLGRVMLDLANNHILDHGPAGLMDTLRFAGERGWPCLGAGENRQRAMEPCVLERSGIRVGLLGVCWHGVPFAGAHSPGVFGDSPERRVRARIRELKRRVRWVVVIYHGGEEFTHVPLPARRNKFLRYLAAGADVVVAHHAHCVQRYERAAGKHVFYGLGNLVFDHSPHRQFEGTDESVLLTLEFGQDDIRFRPLFTRQDRDGKRVLAVPSNPNFRPITPATFAREWGEEAHARLIYYWRKGHEHLSLETWPQRLRYGWRKSLRTVDLIWSFIRDRYGLKRAFILGGIRHGIRQRRIVPPGRETP